MQLGVFTPVFSHFEGPGLSFDEMLDTVAKLGLDAVEFGCGPLNGVLEYCDPDALLANANKLKSFQSKVVARGLTISALACHGNPIHPDSSIAAASHEAYVTTLRLADKLGVSVVNLYSGCPGDCVDAHYPNWVTSFYPPEMAELSRWQWEDVVIPYWVNAGQLAADAGVRLGFEMHPGMVVYNPATLIRLREAAGSMIGANLDVGHMFDQQLDPLLAVAQLGDALVYVSAKDMAVNPMAIALQGVHSPDGFAWPWSSHGTAAEQGSAYGSLGTASYTTRSIGYGHDVFWWKSFVSALRLVGYEGVLSIEQGDPLVSITEGLEKSIAVLREIGFGEPGFGSRPPASVWINGAWQYASTKSGNR